MTALSLPRRFGPYVLLAQRGSGGAGSVYLARPVARPDDPDRAVVIVKLLHPSHLSSTIALQRFRHEAMIAVSVSSPYVVRVFDVGRVGDVPYIAMENVVGWSAADVGRAALGEGRPLAAPLVVAWLCDALLGLAALHGAAAPGTGEPLGIIHRDVSPKNLLIGEDLRLRLIDFGLGTSNVQEWATQADVVLGTPGYMAPEQAARGRLDARTDLYALMVVGFELLTLDNYVRRTENRAEFLRRVIEPERRATGRADVPAGLEAVFDRGLAVDPDQRFADAEALRAALLPFAALTRSLEQLPRAMVESAGTGEVDVTEPRGDVSAPEPEQTVVFATRVGRTPAPAVIREGSVVPTAVRGDPTAVRGEATAVRGDATAVRGEATAVRGEATPVRGEATPVRGEATPVRGEATAVPGARPLRSTGARAWAAALAMAAVSIGVVVWSTRVDAPEVTRVSARTPRGAPTIAPSATAASPSAVAPSPSATAASPSATAASPSAVAPSPSASAASPSATATSPSAAAPSPSASAASPVATVTPPPRPDTARPTPPTPPPRPTAAPRAPATAEQLLDRILERASALRKARPEQQQEIDDIVADASLWSRADDPAQALEMLRRLDARLSGLGAP